MSYKSIHTISYTTASSVTPDISMDWRKSSTSLPGLAMETRTSWSVDNSWKKEENGISGLEKMKVGAKVWNRKMEDLRMELVQMRVETCLAWGRVEIGKELEVGKELEMLKEEVDSTP